MSILRNVTLRLRIYLMIPSLDELDLLQSLKSFFLSAEIVIQVEIDCLCTRCEKISYKGGVCWISYPHTHL